MEQHIEPKVILLAAEKVRQHGEVRSGKHVFEQVELEISYDGYTIMMNDAKVTLTLFFHNKVKADYRKGQDLEDFYKRIVRIAHSDD